MTPEQTAAYINAQATLCQIELAGMLAENKHRLNYGAFQPIFAEDTEEKLNEKMAEFKEMAEKTATLSVEVKGESLEEVREKLRAEFKKQLYDDGEAWEERAALRR